MSHDLSADLPVTSLVDAPVLNVVSAVLAPSGKALSDAVSPEASQSNPLAPYLRRVIALDVLVVLCALSTAVVAALNGGISEMPISSVGVVAASWALALIFGGCYRLRYLATGVEEFRRITAAALVALSLVAVLNLFGIRPLDRLFVTLAIAFGLVLLLLGRHLMRRWLRGRWRTGACQLRVLVIGNTASVRPMISALSSDAQARYRVVGVVPPPLSSIGPEAWAQAVAASIEVGAADVVAIARPGAFPAESVKALAWHLDPQRVSLMISSTETDHAGPRLTRTPVAGMQMIQLDEPQLGSALTIAKRVTDLVVALALIVLLSPLLLLIALVISMTSRGSAIHVQERMGWHGQPFRMLKFRTMRQGSHEQRHLILGQPDDQIALRYQNDPRITMVGRVLRRWSLDELPQLFNVVGGSMSLVGPRPMLEEELELLAPADHQRHLIKPGVTGLWQVSGRKNVQWDERIRLDLWYVAHWSPALDLVIVLRTAKAVLAGGGAY